MRDFKFDTSIFYNSQTEQLYIFSSEDCETLCLLGYGVIWHYIGEL